MTFKSLGVIDPILKALDKKGYTTPTPIQEQSIPILLKGKDLLGVAQTGTGKTAAFTIPIIQLLQDNSEEKRKGPRKIKSLIVTPTRELAIQIADNITDYAKYTSLRNTVIFGGVKQGKQVSALRNGVDILVATPGRLLDLIGQRFITLEHIEFFVLDEADQMLDMGFIHDIKKMLKLLPKKRQSLFFSATMPTSIKELSSTILGDYERVTIKPEQATAERVSQAVYFVGKKSKIKLLTHILEEKFAASEGKEKKGPLENATLVFSRTKHGADRIVKQLGRAGIQAAAIHGNKSQGARQRALGAFKAGDLNVLVATDIAARGIDVSKLSLVINYDLPNVPETYVHRIGRTGRADASGSALSFCDMEEKAYLRDIQKLIGQKVPVVDDHPFEGTINDPLPPPQPRGQRNRGGRQGGNPRNGKRYPQRNDRGDRREDRRNEKRRDDRNREDRQREDRRGNRQERNDGRRSENQGNRRGANQSSNHKQNSDSKRENNHKGNRRSGAKPSNENRGQKNNRRDDRNNDRRNSKKSSDKKKEGPKRGVQKTDTRKKGYSDKLKSKFRWDLG